LSLLDTGTSEAEANMSLDAELLANLETPILHFYDWLKPSATYGYFVDLKKHIDVDNAKALGLSFARRPTGGGIVFHIWDLAFSFLLPVSHPACSDNTLENYKFVNEIVLDAVKDFLSIQGLSIIPESEPQLGPNCHHFCMAQPTIYDVVYNGMKIAGSAQRRTKKGYLHQGTISLSFPDLKILNQVLLSKEEITQAMSTYSFAPIKDNLTEARTKLKEVLHQKFLKKVSF
jgi:lipoate-protein ligase A